MKILLVLGAIALGSACGERAAAPTPTAPTPTPTAPASTAPPPAPEPSRQAEVDPTPAAEPSAPGALADAGGALPVCDEARTHAPCMFLSQGNCFVFSTSPGSAPLDCTKPLPRPAGDACRRTDQCVGVSDEGCCVGCSHPMRTRIAPACAKAIEAAKDCDAVRRLARSKACGMH